ncbi:hypothetical protein [Ruania halotolerans]|uniref:hypothetical protein n=1 Tax=Ruania halotolerans TaxID=2897773 RepID=UPI001E60DD06|nr:hypothetical protein [Ruania halotolerans]UFU06991.1 hypothetical protein LQF10_02455 [Ruania halotolerans]
MDSLQMDFLEDDWVRLVDPLPGWEAYEIDLRAALVDGAPRVVGLRLEPRPGASLDEVVLTANRIRTFPLAALAAAVYHVTHLRPSGLTDALEALERAARELSAEKGPRAITTPQAVAHLYTRARAAGLAPRAFVCEKLNISTRTFDRYKKQAKAMGLLAADDSKETDQ